MQCPTHGPVPSYVSPTRVFYIIVGGVAVRYAVFDTVCWDGHVRYFMRFEDMKARELDFTSAADREIIRRSNAEGVLESTLNDIVRQEAQGS